MGSVQEGFQCLKEKIDRRVADLAEELEERFEVVPAREDFFHL